MKAIVYTQYGPPDVLKLMEVAKPEPREDQVLVKVHAASVSALDYRRFEKLSSLGHLMEEGFIKTVGRALGADIAGVVEAVGASVKQFRPGDEVFVVCAASAGGFAEYACAPENNLALKPANISFEAAAAIPVSGLTALQGLRDKGQIQFGQKVLINGASGGVGSFAVQIAKSFGADVTGVCSTKKEFTGKERYSTVPGVIPGGDTLPPFARRINRRVSPGTGKKREGPPESGGPFPREPPGRKGTGRYPPPAGTFTETSSTVLLPPPPARPPPPGTRGAPA